MITFSSLYAPNEGQIAYLRQILISLFSFPQGPVIIAGDLNYVVDLSADKSHFLKSNLKKCKTSTTLLNIFLNQFNLIDIWRMHHSAEKDYTFYSYRHNVHSQIDYFLISAQYRTCMVTSNIGPKLFSDHAWLECSMQLNPFESRQTSWPLNKSLLFSELNYMDLLKEMEYFFLKKMKHQFPQKPLCGMLLKHT